MDGKEIISLFDHDGLNAEERNYLHAMARRFCYLLDIVEKIRPEAKKNKASILDIGPSYFTELLRRSFPNDVVYTLGFIHDESRGGHLPRNVKLDLKNQFDFDLNEVRDPAKRPAIPAMDIVVFAEVIEHLHTPPLAVLRYIHSIICPGGVMVLQTPNAVSLRKRWAMLKGKNPYEKIRESRDNPGHFREYTKQELLEYLSKAGFAIVSAKFADYFPMLKKDAFVKIFLPDGFKDGITIVAKKS
ncbi:MAG TPA: class I SAM-dependent methyltransferase [Chitinivibrionales bacterium]|nr:class I SAM-dependent methyltransferase [Chitinivibrionales bacterium]